MSDSASGITFVCGFCKHIIRASAESEGRSGRCPRCQHVVQVPTLHDVQISLELADPTRSVPRLHGLMRGVAVSFLLHVLALSALAIVYVRSHEYGRSILITAFFDTEGDELDLTDPLLETPIVMPAAEEGEATVASDMLSSVAGSSDYRVPGPVTGAGRETRLTKSAVSTGSTETLARFSPDVMDRLSRQPAAMRGDYEVALYWNGPSDLDLHVDFQPAFRGKKSSINYRTKGTPLTGFLDVDQNYQTPYVNDPIEHVRWETKSPPSGTYTIRVHAFNVRGKETVVPYTVEIKMPNGVRTFEGTVAYGNYRTVDTLEFGVTPEQKEAKTSRESAELLASAKAKLTSSDGISRRVGIGLLKSVVRRFPSTVAAIEARRMLAELE
ncbi:MAG: hypothetical protein JSS49_28340 [Planctomycetes bacterium]|nr:hypothetical protein [Planctomycetota bacterium]